MAQEHRRVRSRRGDAGGGSGLGPGEERHLVGVARHVRIPFIEKPSTEGDAVADEPDMFDGVNGEEMFLLRGVEEEVLEALPRPGTLQPGGDGAQAVRSFGVAGAGVMIEESVVVDEAGAGGHQGCDRGMVTRGLTIMEKRYGEFVTGSSPATKGGNAEFAPFAADRPSQCGGTVP